MKENSASVRDKYWIVGHSNAGDANRWARPLADPIVRISLGLDWMENYTVIYLLDSLMCVRVGDVTLEK